MSGLPPNPINNNNDDDDDDLDTIEELPPPTPSRNETNDVITRPQVETSRPPSRHMRNHSRDSNSGSSRSLGSNKARLTTLPPATKPGAEPYIPRHVTGAAYVREALAATESGIPVVGGHMGSFSSIEKSKSHDTLVTASTESFDEYVARKRRQNDHLADFTVEERMEEEEEPVAADPYAHLRNQPRRPRPESDSTLMPVAYEVEAMPVHDDNGGKRRKNPLKDWRVLLFLAVALSAIVGLTVALLMNNNDGGGKNQQPTYVPPSQTGAGSDQGDGNVSTTPPIINVPADEEVDDEGGTIVPNENGRDDSIPVVPIPDQPVDDIDNDESEDGGVIITTTTSEPTSGWSTDEPTSEPSAKPTTAQPTTTARTKVPTMLPTRMPVPWPTTDSSMVRPTLAPTPAPTRSPTLAPTPAPEKVVVEAPPPFEMSRFSMFIISSSQIDEDTLVRVTSSHLLRSMQLTVPNLASMSLAVDLSAPAKRYLRTAAREQTARELQNVQFAAYTAIFSGTIGLNDGTFTPTPADMRDALADAFSGANLNSFITEKMSAARVNIGALVVKDADGIPFGSDGGGVKNVYTAVKGSLQTPLTNRFTRSGAMFDITAKDFPVKITSLSIHTQSTGSNIPLEVWTKAGSFVGYEADGSEWDFHNEGLPYILEQGMGLGKLTPIPVDEFEPFIVPAGQTVAVYVTISDGKGMLMGQTSSLGGGKIENSLVQIESGSSVGYRFGQVNKDRAWGGAIQYELATSK